MQLRLPKLNNSGDTLVEVLIAVAVISAILGSAYAITSRSVETLRQSQEHAEALKLAEAQLEQLKSLMDDKNPELSNVSANDIDDQCIRDMVIRSNTASNCTYPPDNRYTVTLNKSASGNSFESIVSWDSLKSGRDRVSIWYRVY